METDTEMIQRIKKIFIEWDRIPLECFSDIYNIAELNGDLVRKIRDVINGGN